MCGIGVTSFIAVISKPAACSDRTADSRPEPGPLINTSTRRKPSSMASFAADSAESCAANGVLLREPLKPILPAEAHEITLPYWSVSVTMVLLNVALICATPLGSTFSFFFVFCRFAIASIPEFDNYFFFAPIEGRRPRRVRALVCVLCPRTGNPRRWRSPR